MENDDLVNAVNAQQDTLEAMAETLGRQIRALQNETRLLVKLIGVTWGATLPYTRDHGATLSALRAGVANLELNEAQNELIKPIVEALIAAGPPT